MTDNAKLAEQMDANFAVLKHVLPQIDWHEVIAALRKDAAGQRFNDATLLQIAAVNPAAFPERMTRPDPAAPTLAPQRVVCAANRNRKTGLIICGARHFDSVMHRQMEARPADERDDWRGSEEGFIDQFGKFLTREEAHVVATERGQFFRRVGGDERSLYSENLY